MKALSSSSMWGPSAAATAAETSQATVKSIQTSRETKRQRELHLCIVKTPESNDGSRRVEGFENRWACSVRVHSSLEERKPEEGRRDRTLNRRGNTFLLYLPQSLFPRPVRMLHKHSLVFSCPTCFRMKTPDVPQDGRNVTATLVR